MIFTFTQSKPVIPHSSWGKQIPILAQYQKSFFLHLSTADVLKAHYFNNMVYLDAVVAENMAALALVRSCWRLITDATFMTCHFD